MPENTNLHQTVYTFYADVTPLRSDALRNRLYEALPDFRKEKADRLKGLDDQILSIGAWTLYTFARQQVPYPHASFNLSHSGTFVLASLAPQGVQVGCDVEMLRHFREKVARRFFCPSEYETIRSAPPDQQAELFYRFWVLKESFLKATRYGMKLGLDSFAFHLDTTGCKAPPVLIKQPPLFPGDYYFLECSLSNHAARAAICSDIPQIQPPQMVSPW